MDTIHDWAPLYTLGALDGEDLTAYEAHLRTPCDLCLAALSAYESVMTQLAYSQSPVSPPPHVRTRLLAKIQDETAAPPADTRAASDQVPSSDAPFVSIRANAGVWEEFGPGVHIKRLYSHALRDYSTALVRMGPGTSYPAHRHLDTEELLVLEGDCHIEGEVFGPGDYYRAEGLSHHGVTYTEGGCLFLVIASGGGHVFE